MLGAEVFRSLLQTQPKRRNPESGEDSFFVIPQIKPELFGENVRIAYLRRQKSFTAELKKAGITDVSLAVVVRVLSQAGLVFLPGQNEAYLPTIKDIREISDTDLLKIYGVRKESVQILRALFGQAENQ